MRHSTKSTAAVIYLTLAFCLLAVGCSRSNKEDQLEALTDRFAGVEAQADQLCDRFAFDEAESKLYAFQDEVRRTGLDPSAIGVTDAIAAVSAAKAAHQKRLAAGEVVFEGRVIPPEERDAIIDEREAAAARQAAELAAREALLDRVAAAAARGPQAVARVRPRLQVLDYAGEAQRRHDASIARLESLLQRSDAGTPERVGWQQELDRRVATGPPPLYFGEGSAADGTSWEFEYGRLGYLRDPVVHRIPDTWRVVVATAGRRIIIARFGTIHLRVGQPLPPPVGMYEVVGVDEYAGSAGPERLIVLEPFSIGPFRGDVPDSIIVE